ncbi:MAG TPA: 16S rRNA (uracil(1498)-N(3))-methyltransferase [Candidatus Dormibacteraeota bacterium]|nr:16S rRNA (uracil(1498)-N(3))-methyltransferase [Candidatus Dormibacteraeota bacterium]
MSRFFVEGSFSVGDRVALAGGDAHRLAGVLRAVPGDSVEILDGRSRRFDGRVREVGRERVTVELVAELPPARREAALAITLAQGVPKGQKMDFVVEKTVELGAARIVPLLSERAVARAEGAQKIERWRRLAKAAALQCGRELVPEVTEPLSFGEALALGREHDAMLMPWELAEARPLRERIVEIGDARRILVLIGPEGGFSQREAHEAAAAGALLISLGPRILRTETAAIVLMAALLALRGEL